MDLMKVLEELESLKVDRATAIQIEVACAILEELRLLRAAAANVLYPAVTVNLDGVRDLAEAVVSASARPLPASAPVFAAKN